MDLEGYTNKKNMKKQFVEVPVYEYGTSTICKILVEFTYAIKASTGKPERVDWWIKQEDVAGIGDNLKKYKWGIQLPLSWEVTSQKKEEEFATKTQVGYELRNKLPSEWRSSEKGNCLKRGGILIICPSGYYEDEFPIKGKFVISKKGTALFFVGEGSNIFERIKSKSRNRMETDSAIEEIMRKSGCIHCSHDKDYRYEVRLVS